MAGLLALFRRFPLLSMVPRPWLEYEDMIEDWLGITNLSPEKWGPSLKNALVGQAEFYKNLLDNQKLRDENNGVAHFKETLRPYFVKGVSYIFMWRFMYLFRCWRTNAMDFITWITRFEVAVQTTSDLMGRSDTLATGDSEYRVYQRFLYDSATRTPHPVDSQWCIRR